MAIDFPPNAVNPNPPQDGDEYLDQASGTTWVYDTTSNSWTLQTSGSPGGGGTAFKGQHDFTQALLPAPAAEAGDIYSQADIGGATGTVDAVYNGIAGEDIEEGTLVLYTGSSWTFLITTPGYPDLGDGQGSTMDERYVLVIGDNMSGDLTLGTDKITLDATDGTANFAGNVLLGGDITSTPRQPGTSLRAAGGIIAGREYRGEEDAVWTGVNTNESDVNKQVTSKIYADGSASFDAGSSNPDGVRITTSGPNKNPSIAIQTDGSASSNALSVKHLDGGTNPDVIRLQADGSASFDGLVRALEIKATNYVDSPYISSTGTAGNATYNALMHNGVTNVPRFRYVFDKGLEIGTNLLNADTVNIELNDDGSADFAGNMRTHTYASPNGPGFSINESGSGDDARAIINIKGKSTTSTANLAIAVRRGDGDGNIVYRVDYGGTASFRNAIFNLEADNDSNYVSTTDVDGNETRVYNGPTLDVKEKLMEALATIEDLKTRVSALEGGGY